jgi:hypothetical protein
MVGARCYVPYVLLHQQADALPVVVIVSWSRLKTTFY